MRRSCKPQRRSSPKRFPDEVLRDDPGRTLDALPRQLERDEPATLLVEALWSRLLEAAVVPDGTAKLRTAADVSLHPVEDYVLTTRWLSLVKHKDLLISDHSPLVLEASATLPSQRAALALQAAVSRTRHLCVAGGGMYCRGQRCSGMSVARHRAQQVIALVDAQGANTSGGNRSRRWCNRGRRGRLPSRTAAACHPRSA